MASSTPSTSLSSSTVEQDPPLVMYHWQETRYPYGLVQSLLHEVGPAPPPPRHTREKVVPAQSGSQASPMWSPSLSTWVGLAVRTQLSAASITPSPSRSLSA